jgi:hypothetical protein
MGLHQTKELLHSKRQSPDLRDSPQNKMLATHPIRDSYLESRGSSKNSTFKESTLPMKK